MDDIDVLVVGAGPVGLTTAIELRRRGIRCRIVDRLSTPPQYAKAVGVQPRTLEVWESMGLLRAMLDAATPMNGQTIYVNGQEVAKIRLSVPPEVPFGFIALPQYATERILTEHLAGLSCVVDRGTELTSFAADADGVSAKVTSDNGIEEVRARYLVGCDGAHSVVRRGLGLNFEGDAFPEEYMIGDVEVDWHQPSGWGVRAMHQTDGVTDDALVCIPLPGHNRYRMSMLVPDELRTPKSGDSDTVAHGMEGGRAPELRHIQAVLDRLSPEPTIASHLRWSSVFRISHRIVNNYGEDRVFVAGDAAHIHPPTGAQGMNTGIQDGFNLAWKLALAVKGRAADGLLATYDAERRPVGEEVVGRTVRNAREGIENADESIETVTMREAQLLVGYPDSPLVVPDDGTFADGAPRPGERAPDAAGMTRDAVNFPVRLFEVMDSPGHTLLLYADATSEPDQLRAMEKLGADTWQGELTTRMIVAPELDPSTVRQRPIVDQAGSFRAAYGALGACWYVVRPDGYIAARSAAPSGDALTAYRAKILRTVEA